MSTGRLLLAGGLVLVARVLDVTVLARWPLPGASPDLTLLVVVSLAVLGGGAVGAGVGLLAGLVADLTPPSVGLLGATALAYGLAGVLAGRWYRPGERSLLLRLPAVAVAALASTAVRVVVATLGGAGLSADEAAWLVVTSVVYAVLLGLLVLPAVAALDRRVEAGAPETVRR